MRFCSTRDETRGTTFSGILRKRWQHLFAMSAVVGIVSFGCATAVRTSSRNHLSVEQSTVVIPYSMEDSIRVLSDVFLKRGYQTVDYRPLSTTHVQVKFRGGHLPVTKVESFYHYVYSTNDVYGSVFAAELTSIDSENTKVYLFGKPTYNGAEPCTKFDPEGSGPCHQIYGSEAPLYGQDEADTVRSVVLELSPIDRTTLQERLSQAETKPIWKCYPSKDPRWGRADPYEKKRMLEACLQP